MKTATRRILVVTAAALVASALIVGCESKPIALPASEAPLVPVAPAAFGAGDDIEIRFYSNPELNMQQKVRADGMISMPLIGDVQVAGQTPTQLSATLEKTYGETHLKDPKISVIVRGMYSRRVIVTGEVVRPGFVDMPAQLTLLEAIGVTGGFTHNTANMGQVIVSRANPETGERIGYVVDMRDEYKGAITMPFLLQPTDIVIVPRTRVVEVNQWMRQYISNNIPGGGNIFYSQSVGAGSITASGSTSPN